MSFWDKLKHKLHPPVVKVAKFKPKVISEELIKEYIKIATALEISVTEINKQIEKLDNAAGTDSTSI